MAQQAGRSVDRSIRLPADLAAMLAEEAALADATEATIVRQALRAYLTARRAEREQQPERISA